MQIYSDVCHWQEGGSVSIVFQLRLLPPPLTNVTSHSKEQSFESLVQLSVRRH